VVVNGDFRFFRSIYLVNVAASLVAALYLVLFGLIRQLSLLREEFRLSNLTFTVALGYAAPGGLTSGSAMHF